MYFLSMSNVYRYEEREKLFSIRMGGLPYRAKETEIQDWFQPEANCVQVKILRSRKDNRPNGEAIADFANKDEASNAMKKNKDYMGDRFVILTPINF